MGIPAGLTRNHIPLHGAVSGDHILDHPGQDVADMGLSVGCRRSVVEHVGLSLTAAVDALFKDLLVLPEFLHLLFSVHKVQIC